MTGTVPRGWWALDLALVAALTGVCGYGIHAGVTGPLRVALALPLVLALPGYALVAGLFPAASSFPRGPGSDRDDGLRPVLPDGFELGGAERVGLSVAFSVAIVPTVAFAVHLGPQPIVLEPVLVGVVGTTLGLDGIALVRRLRVPAPRRFRPRLPWRRSDLAGGGAGDDGNGGRLAGVNLALVASLLLVGASVTYALAVPPPSDGFTEFYLETGDVSGDRQSLHPTALDEGEPTTLPLVVANREGRVHEYALVVLLQDATVSGDERVVRRQVELAREPVAVPANGTVRTEIEVTPTVPGDDRRLVVLLYRGDPPAEPSVETAYRSIDLVVSVRPADGAAAGSGPAAAVASTVAAAPPQSQPTVLVAAERGGR